MSEARLLALVSRYPHPAALARNARDGAVFARLRRLECRGFVRRADGEFRLTRRGRSELELSLALARLVAASARTARA